MLKELKLFSVLLAESSNHEVAYYAIIDLNTKNLIAVLDSEDWGTEGKLLVLKCYEKSKEELIAFVKSEELLAKGVDLKGGEVPKLKVEVVNSFTNLFRLF